MGKTIKVETGWIFGPFNSVEEMKFCLDLLENVSWEAEALQPNSTNF